METFWLVGPDNFHKEEEDLISVGCLMLSSPSAPSGNDEFLEGRREMGMFMMKSLQREAGAANVSKSCVSPRPLTKHPVRYYFSSNYKFIKARLQ